MSLRMMRIASLPMYDLPELLNATNALWAAIADRMQKLGIEAPSTLKRGVPVEKIWTDPELLLSQTCGYPLVNALAGKVALLATPCYDAAGCEGPSYRSAIVVRSDGPAGSLAALRGLVCAVNTKDSHSGMNLLRAEIAPLAQDGEKFFARVHITGSHASSVEAVVDGLADVAAIDCVTWSLLQEKRPSATRDLRVLAWTQSSPGLPLITSLRTDAATRAALLAALQDVVADASLAPVRAALHLEAFVELPSSAYNVVAEMEAQAVASGYPVLR